ENNNPHVITQPPDITLPADNPMGKVVTYTPPTATDDLDGSLPVTCTPPSGGMFPIGETIVTCSATDSSGHKVSVTFKVTVVDGPPTIKVPDDVTIPAIDQNGAPYTFTATASDPYDGPLAVTCTPPSGT